MVVVGIEVELEWRERGGGGGGDGLDQNIICVHKILHPQKGVT